MKTASRLILPWASFSSRSISSRWCSVGSKRQYRRGGESTPSPPPVAIVASSSSHGAEVRCDAGRALPFHPATFYDGRLFVCGDQSGRTSAPISPQAVQTIREHNERTGVLSGNQSAFITVLW
jgi:hypothetical protein